MAWSAAALAWGFIEFQDVSVLTACTHTRLCSCWWTKYPAITGPNQVLTRAAVQGYSSAAQTQYALDGLKWVADYFVKCHHSDVAYTAQARRTHMHAAPRSWLPYLPIDSSPSPHAPCYFGQPYLAITLSGIGRPHPLALCPSSKPN